MRVSVIVFPGSNCDHDVIYTYETLLKAKVNKVWHRETNLNNPDIVILPGGFAHGDYLRTGAMAKVSPIMREVVKFAGAGGPVLGVCNGFQILCEVGLLPGVLLRNTEMKFLSRFVHIKIENNKTAFTQGLSSGDIVTCPIAHGEGNYYADGETLAQLESQGRVVFRYCSKGGKVEPKDLDTNPNGSLNAIAGICNEKGNVVGLMPHPERASERLIGHTGLDSGLSIFAASLG